MAKQILSISQINEYIRQMMDGDSFLAGIAVRGEISNYKIYPSGHHYFTLKDENASLKCVMFRGNSAKLRFRPDNGMQVIAVGRVTVYPRDGAYQLYCTGLMLDGVGDLYAAFEQLKIKLAGEGLFDPSHKKPLPLYPKTIGIITSSAGAAVHDILRIINSRFPIVKVKLLPVRVQGAEAPGEIAYAIDYANRYNLADVLIVGRGGGSVEDLWAFNDEKVAYAIHRSRIPVISAVGHEPDVTISDFVADVRAATPSNAAELVVPDRDALKQLLDTISGKMAESLQQKLKIADQKLRLLAASPALQSPDGYLRQRENALQLLSSRLVSAENRIVGKNEQRFIAASAKLDALSPLKVLSRGYSVVTTEQDSVIRSAWQVNVGDSVRIRLQEGSLTASVHEIEECV